jgi:hypothetical protein
MRISPKETLEASRVETETIAAVDIVEVYEVDRVADPRSVFSAGFCIA